MNSGLWDLEAMTGMGYVCLHSVGIVKFTNMVKICLKILKLFLVIFNIIKIPYVKFPFKYY